MKRVALALVAALTLIAAAGCGGSGEENDYVKELNAADAKAQAALTNVGPTSTTASSAAKRFDATATRLEPALAQYKAIDPPDNAKAAHAETVAGWTGVIALFRRIAADFRAAKTSSQFNAVAEQLPEISSEKPFRQLDNATKKLADAGYTVKAPASTTD